ncbi:MAG TPA: hypothetical protein VMF90_12265 [Rhizobiaceae bacterium]|nr:hypothetical protein [Rhizobiaceae bacterium]
MTAFLIISASLIGIGLVWSASRNRVGESQPDGTDTEFSAYWSDL